MNSHSCLLVEDSPLMRQLVVFALSRVHGISVTEAQDGLDGLKKVLRTRYDLVITDINMPLMDGLKLIRRIRSDARYKDVPIIVISTEGANEDRERAMNLGATAYIEKPIQAPEVVEKVKELLGL